MSFLFLEGPDNRLLDDLLDGDYGIALKDQTIS